MESSGRTRPYQHSADDVEEGFRGGRQAQDSRELEAGDLVQEAGGRGKG